MRKYLFFIYSLALWLPLGAQSVHVYYDAHRDSTYYKVAGEVVERPMVKKGDPIVVHVTNYNDYLYRLDITTQEENYSVPTAGMASMLFGGGNGQGLDILKGMLNTGGGNPFLGDGLTTDDPIFGYAGGEEEVELSKAAKNKLAAFTSVMEKVKTIEADIAKNDQQLNDVILRQENAAFMLSEVSKLRTDPSLSPKTSRRLMIEYLDKLLEIEKGVEFNLDDLLKQADAEKNFMTGLDSYEKKISEMSTQATLAELLIVKDPEVILPPTQLIYMNNSVEDINQRTDELRLKVQSLRQKAPGLLKENLQDLTQARYYYEELKDHRFEKQMIIYPEGDITTLNISLVPLATAGEQVLPVRTASPIKVNSYGGMQINASVGISYASNFNCPEEYVVNESTIVANELDAFSPIVTSYLHFYGQSKRNVTLGGTIGLGLGIGSQAAGGGALSNYFLGPSLIIGKGQRIVLTGGLMGGRVERLTNGLAVGDSFVESIIPTKSIYELGFFFGVSFNVLGQ